MNHLCKLPYKRVPGAPLTLAATAAVLLVLAACTSGTAQTAGVQAISLKAFPGGGAWALTEHRLLRTNDRGSSWTDVTPPGLQGSPTNAQTAPVVFFRDHSLGWVASFEASAAALTSVTVFRTSDGGKTWESSPLLLGVDPGQQFAGTGSLFFLDGSTGWLMAKLQTSSAGSAGVLYRTNDGGNTWTKASIPIGNPVRFNSPSDGWVAGGPAGGEMYVTHDGGVTWSRQEVPQRSADKPWLTTVGVPRFFDASNGVLPVHVRSETVDGSDHYFFVTHDGGTSWASAGPPLETTRGGTSFAASVNASDWFLLADHLYVTHDAGRNWLTVTTGQNLQDAVSVDFVTTEEGWANSEKTTCPGKANCFVESLLLTTQNGGQTWVSGSIPTQ